MPWEKGQSGNPNGRPPRARALTTILEKTGNRTIEDVDGKRRPGKRILARALWEIVTKGQAELPSGKTLKVSPHDWLDIAKWLYAQIDGAPRQVHEHSGLDGGDLVFHVIYDNGPDSQTPDAT